MKALEVECGSLRDTLKAEGCLAESVLAGRDTQISQLQSMVRAGQFSLDDARSLASNKEELLVSHRADLAKGAVAEEHCVQLAVELHRLQEHCRLLESDGDEKDAVISTLEGKLESALCDAVGIETRKAVADLTRSQSQVDTLREQVERLEEDVRTATTLSSVDNEIRSSWGHMVKEREVAQSKISTLEAELSVHVDSAAVRRAERRIELRSVADQETRMSEELAQAFAERDDALLQLQRHGLL